jgi:tRNA (mo5U34)-methyltransferase
VPRAHPGAVDPPDELAQAVAAIPWYHTIQLPGGVVTPGRYDTRNALARLPIPDSLADKRCLDIGTASGFWAFEFERRGAVEVVATDVPDIGALDWPQRIPLAERERLRPKPGRTEAFELAAKALGSRVQRTFLSIYDLTADEVGQFDLVFIGSLLLHLRDPVRALEAVRGVTRGQLLVNDAVSLPLSLIRPREPAAELDGRDQNKWWLPNVAGLARMIDSAGFAVERAGRPYLLRFGAGRPGGPRAGPGASRRRQLSPGRIIQGGALRVGVPHSWVLARPASRD